MKWDLRTNISGRTEANIVSELGALKSLPITFVLPGSGVRDPEHTWALLQTSQPKEVSAASSHNRCCWVIVGKTFELLIEGENAVRCRVVYDQFVARGGIWVKSEVGWSVANQLDLRSRVIWCNYSCGRRLNYGKELGDRKRIEYWTEFRLRDFFSSPFISLYFLLLSAKAGSECSAGIVFRSLLELNRLNLA